MGAVVVKAIDPVSEARGDQRARRAKGHAQRERIVAAAVELLAVKGFRGTTIVQLAEQVGTTHSNLIYYFGSKERLLHEVVAERERQEGPDFFAALESDHPSFTALNAIAHLIVENMAFTRLYVVLGAENFDAGDPLHTFFVDRYERARGFVAIALDKDRAQGSIRSDIDTAQLGREVVATLMGLEIQWLMDPDAIDLLTTVEAYVRGLQDRLAPT
jgi:AcrR family transcriptional regulator